MRITLIFPPNTFQTKPNMPPLGIAWLAAVLRSNGFNDVSLIESMANNYSNEDIIGLLKKNPPDLIGISFGTQIRFSAFDLIRSIKKEMPNISIVVGGPHPTLTAQDTLENLAEIDAVVKGEGEISFLNLVRAMEQGRDFFDVKGISFRDNKGNIVHNPRESAIQDLDALPLPARDLLPIEKYTQRTFLSKKRCTNIMTSRGCPYYCVYCSTSEQWGHSIRHRSPLNVLDEIEYLFKTYPFFEGIRFFDDVFTMDKKRVLAICDEIIRRKLNFVWECEARANTIDEEVAAAMKKAGCEFIDLGIESGSDKILKNIRKGITVEQAIRAAKVIKKAGIGMKAFFMHGLPGETYEDIKKTVFLSRYLFYELGVEGTTQGISVIYPGTEMEMLAKNSGNLPKDFSWAKPYKMDRSYPPLSASPCMPIFEQPGLTYEQVFRYVRQAKFAYFFRHPLHFLKTARQHRQTIKRWLFTKVQ
ncbi:MAG: cobalamin B12-binding domain-containing protein [Candidatus Nealsonbacteria bacterium]|nr:cobalamin B12-binding domain-containing protein [Candidatus Nealsonbacteria bacterium]